MVLVRNSPAGAFFLDRLLEKARRQTRGRLPRCAVVSWRDCRLLIL